MACGFFFRTHGEEDVRHARAGPPSRPLADAQPHGRRRLVRQQHALGILRIAQAVVEQVPVQAIGAGVGMTTLATLPVLEADRRRR